MKRSGWVGAALGVVLVLGWHGPVSAVPRPEQVETMERISQDNEINWPRLLHQHRSVIDLSIIQYLGDRSVQALDRKGPNGQPAPNDHDAFYFALLADEAAREVRQPEIWRLQLADAYWKKGLAAQAFDVLDNLTVSDPSMAEPWMLGGNYLMQLGRLEEARTKYQRALKLAHHSEEALQHLAEIDVLEHNLPAAQTSVKRLLAEYPQNVKGKQLKAMLDAAAPTVGVVKAPPTDVHTANLQAVELYDKGKSELYSGQLGDAESHLRAAVQADPKYADAASLLGDILMRESKYEEAAPFYETAATLSNKAEAWRYAGFGYEMAFNETHKAEYLDRAIAGYQQAVQLDPANAQYKAELDRVSKKRS